MLIVLHDLNLAARYADRIAVQHRGGVLVSAPPSIALSPERLASVFGVAVQVVDHPSVAGRPFVLDLGPLDL